MEYSPTRSKQPFVYKIPSFGITADVGIKRDPFFLSVCEIESHL